MTNTSTPEQWKQRLYDSYLSNGERLPTEAGPETLFRPRSAYLRAVIKRYMPTDRGVRIVDLGCGHGALLYFLGRAGYHNALGIDLSTEQVDAAHRLGVTEARLGDLEALLIDPLAEHTDVFVAFDVLEHLCGADMFSVLENIHRNLTSGGRCIVHVPNAEGIFGMRIRYGDLTHEQAFTAASLRQAFRSVGFRHVDCFEEKPTVHGVMSLTRRLIWELGTLWHRALLLAESRTPRVILSQNIIAVAVK